MADQAYMDGFEVKVQKTRYVWVAWTNTDLTEGRGEQVPLVIAESRETAERLGAKGGVMGSPCRVSREISVSVGSGWLVPGVIERENGPDKVMRLKRENREAVIEKAKSLGLSVAEIEALKS